MMWNDWNGAWWMWLLGPLCMVAIVGVIAWVAIKLARLPDTTSGTDLARQSPTEVLDERFARGEIDESEYQRRLVVLRGGATAGDRP